MDEVVMNAAGMYHVLSFSQKGCQTAVLIESLLVNVAGLLNQSNHPKIMKVGDVVLTLGCGGWCPSENSILEGLIQVFFLIGWRLINGL